MKTYSMDLRERVVAACFVGDGTREQIAARFSVSVSWIRDLLKRRRETGSIASRPHGGGRPPAFDGEAAERLRAAVAGDDDVTLAELAEAAGVACVPSAVYGALKRLGITRKKSRGGRPSGTDRSGRPSGRRGARSPPRWTRRAWSSSTRAAPPRRWTARTAAPPAAGGSTARSRTATGWSRP